MSPDLDPITPSAALDYYVDDRRGELAGATLRDHEYRIGTFVDWLEDRKGIQNMNEVDVRMVHECGCGSARTTASTSRVTW